MMDVENYRCRDCIHFRKCKRIDHKKVKFAMQWFVCDKEDFYIVCCEFEPHHWMLYAREHWTDFWTWWEGYVEQWLPYSNTNKNVYFTLHNDTSIRYGVPLMDYVKGTMFDGEKLKAVEKMYYRRTTKSPIGYELVRESIDGVLI